MSLAATTPFFSGVTWGILTTLKTSFGATEKKNSYKRADAELKGRLASAFFLCFAMTPIRVGFIPRTLAAVSLTASVGYLDNLYGKRADYSPNTANLINRIYKQQDRILLGLNIASAVVEVMRGQVAYPLTRLAVVANILSMPLWHKKCPRLFVANMAALAVLSCIQPVRGLWYGICRTGAGIAHLHSLNPRIFRAVAIVLTAKILALVIFQALSNTRNR